MTKLFSLRDHETLGLAESLNVVFEDFEFVYWEILSKISHEIDHHQCVVFIFSKFEELHPNYLL